MGQVFYQKPGIGETCAIIHAQFSPSQEIRCSLYTPFTGWWIPPIGEEQLGHLIGDLIGDLLDPLHQLIFVNVVHFEEGVTLD